MSNLEFQSQTGFPGHLALATARESISALMFQSQTGFPGHLALKDDDLWGAHFVVSIPDGLPRPFSRCIEHPYNPFILRFNPRRASQAI